MFLGETTPVSYLYDIVCEWYKWNRNRIITNQTNFYEKSLLLTIDVMECMINTNVPRIKHRLLANIAQTHHKNLCKHFLKKTRGVWTWNPSNKDKLLLLILPVAGAVCWCMAGALLSLAAASLSCSAWTACCFIFPSPYLHSEASTSFKK